MVKSSPGIESKLITGLLAGVIPVLVIYLLEKGNILAYLSFESLQTLSKIPSVISSGHFSMTKLMDIYCKIVPIYAFLIYVFFLSRERVMEEATRTELTKSFFICLVFLIASMFFLSFNNIDLIHSNRLLKLASINEETLLFFYISLYSIFYVFTMVSAMLGFSIFNKKKGD